eukprot:scaffold73035_cov68-Phaeocystis_antarctica.AAC.3
MGAPLAARSLVAGCALGAVHATEARGYVAGSVACLDVGGAVLTEREAHTGLADLQGHGGESEADECATHVIVIARLAADLIFRCSSVVKRPCRAAAVVVAHGTLALSR